VVRDSEGRQVRPRTEGPSSSGVSRLR
jgi:hypothetical protein